jgi:hypothetical protein
VEDLPGNGCETALSEAERGFHRLKKTGNKADLRKRLREGSLDDKEIEIELAAAAAPAMDFAGPGGMEDIQRQLQGMLQGLGGRRKTRKLTVAEVQARIEGCYRPYHAALDQAIDQAYAGFGAVWHLNVHSMPDDSYARLGLPEKPLADFVLGDLDGRTAGEPLMALIEGALREQGYSVARNDPFKGVEIIRASGQPARSLRARQSAWNTWPHSRRAAGAAPSASA